MRRNEIKIHKQELTRINGSGNEPFEEDSCERLFVSRIARAIEAHYRVRELKPDTSQKAEDWDKTLKPTYALTPNPGARPTGRFANIPIKKLARQDAAAVPVIKSRRISFLQRLYCTSVTHKSVDVGGQTHVPPESDMMEAFTEMMYAIDACRVVMSSDQTMPNQGSGDGNVLTHVVRPARISEIGRAHV